MANKRLISYNALYEAALDEYRKGNIDDTSLNDIIKLIDLAPTVDAMEVVPCKHCKWRGTPGCIYYHVYSVKREDDDFCSDGERSM